LDPGLRHRGDENPVDGGGARRREFGAAWQRMPLLTAPWTLRPGRCGVRRFPRGRARAQRGARARYASRRRGTPPIEKAWRPGSPAGGGVPIISREASVPQRYGVALAATTVAYGASLLLWPLIDPNAFAPFCAAVMVSAWYGGLGPGLLATGLATGASAHLLTSSVRLLQSGVNDAVRLGLFMGAAVLISALNARWKRAERERERMLERAEAERGRLEAVLQQLPAGVVIADAATGRILHSNRQVEEILRRPLPPALERYEEYRGFHPDGRPYRAEEWPLARSLDYQTTLASLAHLAVPFLADWCKIDMLEPDGGLRRIAIAYADPMNAELARALATCPPDPRGTHPRTKVVQTGRSELLPEVTDEALVAAAADSEQLAVLRQLGYRSTMIVPLVARGQTLGAMTV